jgi:diguanylate cyclase (GGDEF)-like protein
MNNQASYVPVKVLDTDGKVGQYVTRLRIKFLLPLIGTLSFAVTLVIAIVYYNENRSIDGDVMQLQATVNNLFQGSIQQNAEAMHVLLDVLKTDSEITSALAARDRQRLMRRSAPIFEDINHHFGVTHFYFSDPDRVNLLRVHKREKYGDIIDRQTTLAAQKGGAGVYGVELGPLGTLTLRYVQPWYEENAQELLGFVELGMEIDQVLDSIRDSFGSDIFVLIRKRYLEEAGWKDGMKTFGKVSDWELFPQVVVGMHGRQSLPEELSALILEKDFNSQASAVRPQLVLDNQYAVFNELHDVSGRPVGAMVMIFDTSRNKKHIRETVIIGSGSLIMVASMLVMFFYWFVGRIGERMAIGELQLQQMATHDGLTGLFNRRQFNQKLQDSLDRYTRYGRPVSLLIIDIDHFKQVNDTYGHPAGDAILVELGKRLARQARAIDHVCRYGGEEFTVLLSETNSRAASYFAQRLCEIMENEPWDLGIGTRVSITVSIGIASCPEHADEPQTLVAAADRALYAAKQAGRNRVCSYSDIPGEK